MANRLWILAAGPEMDAIESLLRECGECVVYATGPDGQRVHPGNAYSAVGVSDVVVPGDLTAIYLVECGLPRSIAVMQHPDPVSIDHHREGDPGYGRPPAEFLRASSIGQVIAELARLGGLSAWPGYTDQDGGYDPDYLARVGDQVVTREVVRRVLPYACSSGIEEFAKRHFPGRESVTVRELMPHRNNSHVEMLVSTLAAEAAPTPDPHILND